MIEFKVVKTDWDELEKLGYASVTDYCRYLVKQGGELPNRIEVYRGEMLCISVNNVVEAALLEPTSTGWQTYTEGNGLKARRSPAKPRGFVKNEIR